jgi:hypothetical protein
MQVLPAAVGLSSVGVDSGSLQAACGIASQYYSLITDSAAHVPATLPQQ